MGQMYCKPGVVICNTVEGSFIKGESYMLPDGRESEMYLVEIDPAMMLVLMEMYFEYLLDLFPEGCSMYLIRMDAMLRYKEAQRQVQQAQVVGEAQRIFTEGEIV